MTGLTERQHSILLLAKTSGIVQVEALAEHFGVTPQTVRSDLNELCEQRLLNRTRGGAVVVSSVETLRYEARRLIAADQKRAIGEAAAKLIPNNSSLFINIGTTTEEVARSLVGHRDLLVITNNLNIATRLHPDPHIEVILAGGPVRRSDGAVTGIAAIDLIRQFKVDNAIIGCSALDEDGALLDFDYQEVRVSQTIIENARRVILVTDRHKLEKVAPIRIADIRQVQVFVTDRLENTNLAKICAQAGVQVIETDLAAPAEAPAEAVLKR